MTREARLLELATANAEDHHEDAARWGEDGHDGEFETRPHETCVWVREASAPPAAESVKVASLRVAELILKLDTKQGEELLSAVNRLREADALARGESAQSLPPPPVLDAFDAKGEARDPSSTIGHDWDWQEGPKAVAAKLRRAFFLGQQTREASAPPAAEPRTGEGFTWQHPSKWQCRDCGWSHSAAHHNMPSESANARFSGVNRRQN